MPEEYAKIFYTLDGSQPIAGSNEYKQNFTIDKTTYVKAFAVNEKGEKSFTVESKLIKMPNDWTVKLFSKYNRQYTGGGDHAIIDGIRGSFSL